MRINRRLNQKRKTPVIAAVMSLALVAGGVAGVTTIEKTQDVAPEVPEVVTESASLSDGDSVVVPDPAVAAQGEGEAARTVKEFYRENEFSMFALNWEGNRDIVSYVRAEREPGVWSEWYELPELEGPDGQEADGTDIIWIEPTHRIQVSTGNVDLVEADIPPAPEDGAAPEQAPAPAPAPAATNYGDIAPVADEVPFAPAPVAPGAPAPAPAPAEPVAPAPIDGVTDGEAVVQEPPADEPVEHTTASDIEAIFVDPGEGTAENPIAPAANAYSWAMPKVITRAQWGAGASSTPYYSEPVKAATVHHTAGSNNYTEAESAGIVRGIWTYHAINNRWGDIGYNALVDKYGNIYEGHAGGLDRGPQGAHAYGFNNNTFGISILGNYEEATPTQASLRAVGEMIGWKAAVHNFDPTSTVYLNGRTLPAIFMHKDVGNTACAGRYVEKQMPYIRQTAKAKYNQLKGSTGWVPSTTTTQEPTPSGETGTNTGTTGKTGTTDAGDNTMINNLVEASSMISFEKLAAGDPLAIATAIGTVIGALLLAAAGAGLLPQLGKAGNAEIIPGVNLAKALPFVGKAIEISGNQKANDAWTTFEPILGKLVGTVAGAGGTPYAFFDNGIATEGIGGDEILMGPELSSAWLKQGGDLGALGRPVKDESAPTNGDFRISFERGFIYYDAKTGVVDVTIDK